MRRFTNLVTPILSAGLLWAALETKLIAQQPLPPTQIFAEPVDVIFDDMIAPPAPGLTTLATPPNPALTSDEEYQAILDELHEMQVRIKNLESVKTPKPEIKETTFPTHKITGFFQLDGGLFDQSENNKQTVGNAQNGLGFRRARLAVNGRVATNTNYQIEFDFATAGRPSFFDTYIEQVDLPYVGNARIGQYCQPFSLDALTGFRNLTFIERSLPFLAFVPFRRLGAQINDMSEDEMTQWAVSMFRTGAYRNAPLGDNRYGTDIGDSGGLSVSTRITHVLSYDETIGDASVWAIGGSYNFSELGANTDHLSSTKKSFYQTRVLPEFGMLGFSEDSQPFGSASSGTPSMIDSGRFEADNFQIFGVESLWQCGPLGAQTEFMATLIDTPGGTVFYHGAYYQLAYRLTGEHREYNKKNGTLAKLTPFNDFYSTKKKGIQGWGAWEVAGRVSYVDIRNPDSLTPYYMNGTSDTGNGTLVNTTLGLSWFINGSTKIQGNWIHCMLDNENRGESTANMFVTRFQVDY